MYNTIISDRYWQWKAQYDTVILKKKNRACYRQFQNMWKKNTGLKMIMWNYPCIKLSYIVRVLY